MGCYAPVTTDYCAFSTNTEISCYCTEPNCQPPAPPSDLLDIPEFAESPSDDKGRLRMLFRAGRRAFDEAYRSGQQATIGGPYSASPSVVIGRAVGAALGCSIYILKFALQ
jgi:hypothetical protein